MLPNKRATRPSTPSKKPASNITMTAKSQRSESAREIEVIPQHNAKTVTIFGAIAAKDKYFDCCA
ncbi:MAG: hypothetical protein NTX76_03310 [Alphaproteobacteria bacterium]|nr:hypothetical protein [Alphaproteobacteria bacterium]